MTGDGMTQRERDQRRAFDLIADLLEGQGFPWDDRARNREAVKHAFIEAHRRGFRVRIDRIEDAERTA